MSETEIRKSLLRKVEEVRNSNAILYVTGDRQGLETKIGQDVIDLFVDHLDAVGPVDKISLILYTAGGDTSAAWNLVNLVRMFCEDFEVIVPGKCMSAGTLISLGANRIVMTKQATLGPIDPTIQHPLGPSIPGASVDARVGVSVEAVNGYLDAIRNCGNKNLEGQALLDLSNKVHPLVLGQIFRSRQQIRDLAEKLLNRSTIGENKVQQIVGFLCSESGSHDYTINRREAVGLGLNIEKCSSSLYGVLRSMSQSYSIQMKLREPHDVSALVATRENSERYAFTRAIIESFEHGSHHFTSEGVMETIHINTENQPKPTIAFQDHRHFEGWRKVS